MGRQRVETLRSTLPRNAAWRKLPRGPEVWNRWSNTVGLEPTKLGKLEESLVGERLAPYSITRHPRRAPVGGVPTLTTRAHMNQPEKSTRHPLRGKGRHRIAEAGAAQAELRAQVRPCEARSGRVRRHLPCSSSLFSFWLRPPSSPTVKKRKHARICIRSSRRLRVGTSFQRLLTKHRRDFLSEAIRGDLWP